jgi:hypothetical protein
VHDAGVARRPGGQAQIVSAAGPYSSRGPDVVGQ